MMKRLLPTILLSLLFLLSVSPRIAHAGTYDIYANQYLSPTNITADDLKAKLEKEVQKVVNAGHLAPFRSLYGETEPYYAWVNRYDSVYTLSLAYPYLSPTLQAKVKTYLVNEMQTYPVWIDAYGDRFIKVDVGTKRSIENLPPNIGQLEGGNNEYGGSFFPKLFALYALWLYAHNTGDWTYINNNWSTISSWYMNNRAETSKFYTSISGAIGVYRLALEKPTPDTAVQAAALADINAGMAAGKDFITFSTNEQNTRCKGDAWYYLETYSGCQFVDISPEIGKYMADDPSLKALILGNTRQDMFSLKRAEYEYPLWYIARANEWSHFYGEGVGVPTVAKAMIFPIKAWVQKESGSQLRKYVGVPDTQLGDFWWMQNITRVIQAQGQECWENMQTTTIECPNTTSLSPTPSNVGNGDANSDGVVTTLDIKTVLQNWLSFLTSAVDQYKDGRINSLDAVRVIKQIP